MKLPDVVGRKPPEVTEVSEEAKLPLDQRFRGLWIGLALAITFVFFTLFIPGFRFTSPANLANIALDASEILILAVTTTFVIIAAGIDLSVGSMLILSSVTAAITMASLSGSPEEVRSFVFPRANIGIPVGVAVGLATGTVCGLINGILISRLRLEPFIVTLGTLGVYRGFALVLTGGTNQAFVPKDLQQLFGEARFGGIVPVPVVVALVLAGLGWIVLSQTVFGAHTYAIGSNRMAARLGGIRIERHMIILYTLNGLAAGIAGMIDLARFNTTSIESHTLDNLLAIEAVVLGGTSLFGGIGGMSGTILGAFFPSVLFNGFIQLGVQPFWQYVVIGVVLIIAISQDAIRRARSHTDE